MFCVVQTPPYPAARELTSRERFLSIAFRASPSKKFFPAFRVSNLIPSTVLPYVDIPPSLSFRGPVDPSSSPNRTRLSISEIPKYRREGGEKGRPSNGVYPVNLGPDRASGWTPLGRLKHRAQRLHKPSTV